MSYNEKHWSNEAETMALSNKIVYTYVTKVKEELDLPATQKALLVWDAFKAQSTDKVLSRLERLNIKRCRSNKEHNSSVAAFGSKKKRKRLFEEDGEAWFQ